MASATPKTLTPVGDSQSADSGPQADRPVEGDSTALYELTAEERNARIAEVAYRIAERRGFAPGSEKADWLEAEREVDANKPSNEIV
jgi:hypothetical protein